MKIKCDYCEKPATNNLQKIWINWDYRNDEYSKEYKVMQNIPPASEENLHLCHRCLEKWESGEI